MNFISFKDLIDTEKYRRGMMKYLCLLHSLYVATHFRVIVVLDWGGGLLFILGRHIRYGSHFGRCGHYNELKLHPFF